MIPLTHGLILAAILFVLGLTGLVIRRNLLFMLISLEIMINAAALAFVVAGSYWGQADGQIMYILAISLAAAEASIGLALLLQLVAFRALLQRAGTRVMLVLLPLVSVAGFAALAVAPQLGVSWHIARQCAQLAQHEEGQVAQLGRHESNS